METTSPPPELPNLLDPLAREAYAALYEVLDPETGLSLPDLGLIYGVAFEPSSAQLQVTMTLTTRACPAGGMMVEGVKNRLGRIEGVKGVEVEVVFEPPWSPDRVSAEGRAQLGWDQT